MPYAFQNPDDSFRGLDLWMLNNELHDDELRRQVREFREKGLYSVIARTYNGLHSDYPGEKFMHSMEVILDEAKKTGLKIALQAGYMPAAVPTATDDHAMHYIVVKKRTELTGEETVLAEDDRFAYTVICRSYSLNLFMPEAVDRYVVETYETFWDRFKDEFGKTVISVWVDEPRYTPLMLPYSPDLPEVFEKTYGYPLLENIPALYTDVGDYKKFRYDYFNLLEARLEHYYITVSRWCREHHLQFSGHLMAEETTRGMISQSLAVMPYYKYFDIPGIDALRTIQSWNNNDIKVTSFGLPEKPYTVQPVEPTYYTVPMQCVSAAEQAGKTHILCEMFAVSSSNLGFREQMNLFDHFASLGITHQCVHALFYSIAGFRKRFYPQQFNSYQPFWKDYKNMKDYVARTARFAASGERVADTLVIHPLETGFGLFRGLSDQKDRTPFAEIDRYDEIFYQFATRLISSQIEYQLGDQYTMRTDAAVEGTSFRIGKRTYRRVVLPRLETLRHETVALLEAFAANGGEVIFVGSYPTRLDGRADDSLASRLKALPGAVFHANDEDCIDALAAKRTIFYSADGGTGNTIINHRAEPDGSRQYVMVFNRNYRRALRSSLTLPGRWKPFRFDAEHNTVLPLSCTFDGKSTFVPFVNEKGGSALIVFEKTEEALPAALPAPKPYTVLPTAPLAVSLDSPNLMTLEYAAYRYDGDADLRPELVTERIMEDVRRKGYSGGLTLRFAFRSAFAAKGLKLVCEEPEKCAVTFNGVPVDTCSDRFFLDRSFLVLDLPDVCRAGDNFIEFTRTIEPGQPGEKKVGS